MLHSGCDIMNVRRLFTVVIGAGCVVFVVLNISQMSFLGHHGNIHYNEVEVITKPTTISPDSKLKTSDFWDWYSKNVTNATNGITSVNQTCPYPSPFLERSITVNTAGITIGDVTQQLKFVESGGVSRPTLCKARSKVAIVVAFRDREEHLGIFLRHLHPFLHRQLIDYRIFLIQMTADGYFNKGSLFNAGFREIQSRFPAYYDCMVLQDVDVLPETDRISYACRDTAWHLAGYVDKFKYKMFYHLLIGGSFQISFRDYAKANGFSNQFLGWGGEDDDFERRLKKHNITYGRDPEWSRWTTLKHKMSPNFEKRTQRLWKMWEARFQTDGLSDLNYKLVQYKEQALYTNITVKVNFKNTIPGKYTDINSKKQIQL